MKNNVKFFCIWSLAGAFLFFQMTFPLSFPSLLKGVNHWSIAVSMPFSIALDLLLLRYEKIFQKKGIILAECTHKELVERIRNVLKKMGLPYQEIIIKKWASNASSQSPLAVFHNKLIVINEDYLLTLPQDAVEGVVGHEVAHILNNDVNKRIIVAFLTPLFTHVLCRSVAYLSNSPYLLSLENGLLELGINFFLIVTYIRFQEKRADLTAARLVPDALPGFIAFIKNFQTINGGDNYLDLTHPLLSTRLAYLEKELYKRGAIPA